MDFDPENQNQAEPEVKQSDCSNSTEISAPFLEIPKSNDSDCDSDSLLATTLECKELIDTMVNAVSVPEGFAQCQYQSSPLPPSFDKYLDEVLEQKKKLKTDTDAEPLIANCTAPIAAPQESSPDPKEQLNANPSKIPQTWNLPISKSEIFAMIENAKAKGTFEVTVKAPETETIGAGAGGIEKHKMNLPVIVQEPLPHFPTSYRHFAAKTLPSESDSETDSIEEEDGVNVWRDKLKAYVPAYNRCGHGHGQEESQSQSQIDLTTNFAPQVATTTTAAAAKSNAEYFEVIEDELDYLPGVTFTCDASAPVPVFLTQEAEEEVSIKEKLSVPDANVDFNLNASSEPESTIDLIDFEAMDLEQDTCQPSDLQCSEIGSIESIEPSEESEESEIEAQIPEVLFPLPPIFEPFIFAPIDQVFCPIGNLPGEPEPCTIEEVPDDFTFPEESEADADSAAEITTSIFDSEPEDSTTTTATLKIVEVDVDESAPDSEIEEVAEAEEEEKFDKEYSYSEINEVFKRWKENGGRPEAVAVAEENHNSEELKEVDEENELPEVFADEVKVPEESAADIDSTSKIPMPWPKSATSYDSASSSIISVPSAEETELLKTSPEISEHPSTAVIINPEHKDKDNDNDKSKLEKLEKKKWDSDSDSDSDSEAKEKFRKVVAKVAEAQGQGFFSFYNIDSTPKDQNDEKDFIDHGKEAIGIKIKQSDLTEPSVSFGDDAEEATKNEEKIALNMDDQDSRFHREEQHQEPEMDDYEHDQHADDGEDPAEILMKFKSTASATGKSSKTIIFDQKKMVFKKGDSNKRRKWCAIL